MCGIAGFLDRSATDAGAAAARVERMSDTLAHRGPDDRGAWTDPREGVALGHRRLSVIDLSAAGHQPMTSPAGRYVIVYNGEIYNFRELRDSLDGVNWRGESDTEVLLALIERDGVEAALGRCAGMFAFALWDRQERCLWLARDRMGEKPLYYGWLGQTLVFASELKAIRAHPDFKGEIDRDALTLFLRHNYIPAPHSVYRGIRKLPPGHFLRLPWPTDAKREFPSRAYWSLREIADRAIPDRARQRDPQVALEELEQTLRLSVGQMMIADVPVGALLSGGIDSTLVTALMQSQHRQPVRTFTIGFNESDYDEAQYARAIAGHLGTDHHELYLGPADARAIIPELPALYDEPFSDSSQIPTFLVSRLARENVTVALSGDGGDELFAGYERYFIADMLWRRMGRVPTPIRRGAASLAGWLVPAAAEAAVMRLAVLVAGRKLKVDMNTNRFRRLLRMLRCGSGEALYRELVSHWRQPDAIVLGSTEPDTPLNRPNDWIQSDDFIERMMYLDAITYLPDDILTKVDRASMGVSLEVRVPLLDHRVAEQAWRMPQDLKMRDGRSKWALRQLLARHVPAHLTERPKMGFGMPVGEWLAGPLREWMLDLLEPARLRQEQFFHEPEITRRVQEHLAGTRNWQYYLWDILMFQAWYAENR